MQFKSVQTKIAIWAGACLIVSVVIIIGYSSSVMRDQANTARAEATKVGRDLAVERSAKLAASLKTKLEGAMSIGRILAQTFSGIKNEDNEIELDRDEANSILRIILERNPDLVGIYTAWEPNVFDGMDKGYAGDEGHDQTGRFIPYWARDKDGKIAVEPLIGYDKEGDGDYYLLPKKTKKECIINPYVYPVQGKDTLITSLVVPIVVNDVFYGIAGVDLRLDGFQEIVDDVEDFYNGKVRIAIVSNGGVLVAVTAQPELQGKHMKEIHDDWQEDIVYIQKGEAVVEDDEGQLATFIPFYVGDTTTPWSVNIQIPHTEITAGADRLMSDAMTSLTLMIIIAGICAAVALIVVWLVSRGVARPLRAAADFADRVRKGDVSKRMEVTSDDEVGHLAQALNDMAEDIEKRAKLAKVIASGDLTHDVELSSDKDVLGHALRTMSENLNQLVGQVNESAVQIDSGSSQVSDASQSLSQGSVEQASSLEEISSSMTEIGSQTKANADNATQANQLAASAMHSAEKGNSQMQQMVSAMTDIDESSQQISKIIKVIDDIAFQTNLLALNAAVEAARAGKHGKGFAVVAEEVRSLAGRSAKAAHETGELIEGASKKVQSGTLIAGQTEEALCGIVTEITKVADLVGEIASASNEQAEGISQVSIGLQQIDGVTQQNAANAEETASASEELSSQATIMQRLLSRFTLKNQHTINHSMSDAVNLTNMQALGNERVPTSPEMGEWGSSPKSPANESIISLDDDNFGKY